MNKVNFGFISGTGRCGSTVIKYVLSLHSKVFSFPYESLFIDYPHGVIQLFKSLTTEWTPLRAETALREFEIFILHKRSQLLYFLYRHLQPQQGKRRLFSFISPPQYLSLDISEYRHITKKYLEVLKKDLKTLHYCGCWPGMPAFKLLPQMSVVTEHNEEMVAKYLNKFLNNVFMEILAAHSKNFWLDDSIYIHLHAHELLKIFPQAKFVHLYRDPRDVISSYLTRLWSPSDVVQAAKLYQSIMARWYEIRTMIPQDRFIEVKFEDIILDREKQLRNLLDFFGLPWEKQVLDYDLRKHHIGRWKKDLSPQAQGQIEPFIKKYLVDFGYVSENTEETKKDKLSQLIIN